MSFLFQYLSLPNNNLKKINEDIFSQFPFMTWFDVRNNKIQEFPKVTNHKHLEQILLGGNKIEKLPIELGKNAKFVCVLESYKMMYYKS